MKFKQAVLSMLLTLFTTGSIAAVNVSVFPDMPNIAESFRIIFTADEKISGDPDFAPLDNLFEVLGQNQSTQVQWVNGKHSATTRWELEVIAKKAGDLVIPSIKFGASASQATSITVVASGNGGTTMNDDLLLEIAIDDEAPYVQQQVLLTIRLLRRISLSDAKLTEPATSGDVIIKPLSKDRTYQDERNGKRYEVFERRFALFPQASGRLEIEPFTVTTQVSRGSRSLFDPFRSSTTTRRVRSNALLLDVKPIPASFTGDTWLPATKLSLREEWDPDNDTITNGEPATRTLYLSSDGLTAGQLPDFSPLNIESTTVYPDQVQTQERESENGFTAIKQQKFALITKFTDPGATPGIAIPPIELPWWNIETDQMEIARVSGRTLNVRVPAGETPQGPASLAEAVLETEASTPLDLTPAAESAAKTMWRPLALSLLAGWVLTLLIWFWHTRKHATAPNTTVIQADKNPKLSKLERDLNRAARSDDPYTARQVLLAWGKIAYRENNLLSLGQLARLVVDNALAAEIRRLDAHFYSQSGTNWFGKDLMNAFKNNAIDANSENTSDGQAEELDSLFKLA